MTPQVLTTANEFLVALNDVHFSFGQRVIYDGLNLNLRRSAVTVVMGPSGCGKSTMLNLVGGRLRANRGQVLFDGTDVGRLSRSNLFTLRQRMGMMFQSSALLTDLSVMDNVAFALREHTALDDAMIRTLVLLKLQMVGLRGAADMMPAELSGGMARRVALARATVLDPDLIMYDEPFTGLDPISMGVVVRLIRELNDVLGLTSVVVTHDVAEGTSIADYVYILGNGRVVGEGTPEALRNSDKEEIHQFMHGLPDGPVAFHYPAPSLVDDVLRQQ